MKDMKKRIISLLLVVVMAVMMLASCGAYNFAEENLDGYVTVKFAELKDALAKIEIEDGDFTTNEETRIKERDKSILSAIQTAVISDVTRYEDDKLTSGNLGSGREVVYFCYYTTFTDGEGENQKEYIYNYSHMDDTKVTSAGHVVKLGTFDEDDELIAKIAEAVKTYSFDGEGAAYATSSKSDLDDIGVKYGDTVVVSYTVAYKVGDKNYTDKAAYQEIVIDRNSDNPLAKYIAENFFDAEGKRLQKTISDKTSNLGTLDVGLSIEQETVSGDSTTKKVSFVSTVEGVEYTYSSSKILWKVDTKSTAPIIIKHTPYDKTTEVTPDYSYNSVKVDLKDKELTYHIYPVYYLAVPEVNAASILQYVTGKNVSDSSFEIFEDETYKNGETKLHDLVHALADIYNNDYKTDTEFKNLVSALEKAEDAVSDAGANATDAQKQAVTDAKTALDNAKAARQKIADQIAKIVAATNGTDNAAEKILAEHEKNTYNNLKAQYDQYIVESVQKEAYKLIFESKDYVTLTGAYPEKVLEDFEDHIYESYEYKFYKENYTASGSTSSTSESNYTHYNGDFNAYLEDQIKQNGSIEAQAKEKLDPILKLYAVAKAFDADGATTTLSSFIEADIAAGLYDARYEDDATDKEKKEADKTAEESKEEARKTAQSFLVTDKVYKDFKKTLGSSLAKSYEDEYGEINIRAGLQFNRLFFFLASTEVEWNEELEKQENKYTAVTGEDAKLAFRGLVQYTIKADSDAE